MNRFHCCATCEHFRAEKRETGTSYRCARLTYETRPEYRFNCWSPKQQVRSLMAKEAEKRDVL